jgi:hypothetical protein
MPFMAITTMCVSSYTCCPKLIDQNKHTTSNQSGHHTGQSFTQSGPGAQGTGSNAHGTLGSGTTSGGIGGDGTSQGNTGGPPGLQDYLGDNAQGQGGLAAQAAGGPGAPGQPGQIGGGVGSRYVRIRQERCGMLMF